MKKCTDYRHFRNSRNNNYSLSKCSGAVMHNMTAGNGRSYQWALKSEQTMASPTSVILSVTIWSSATIGQRATQIPICCNGDSFLHPQTLDCKHFKRPDERMLVFPGQKESLSVSRNESEKKLIFSQINFQSTGEIESFDVNLAIPTDALTRRFNCDTENSRLIYNFTNLNTDMEQVLLDSLTLTTHEHYCIDVAHDGSIQRTVGLVCDPCTDERPCVSICSGTKNLFSQDPDGNYTMVVVNLDCSEPLLLTSDFFSVTATGDVTVHDIKFGYKDYCLRDSHTLSVCRSMLIMEEDPSNITHITAGKAPYSSINVISTVFMLIHFVKYQFTVLN